MGCIIVQQISLRESLVGRESRWRGYDNSFTQQGHPIPALTGLYKNIRACAQIH